MFVKKLFKYIWISILIAIVINLINFIQTGALRPWKEEWESLWVNFIFSFFITVINTSFFNFLGKFYSWTENGLKRIVFGAIGTVITTMVTLFVLLFCIRVFYFGQPVEAFFEQQNLDWYLFGFTFTMIMSVLFHAFYFYKELQARKVKEQKVIARSATAQFDALKNQLDPHFLFNSLNVLVSLIEENPKAATKFTTSLSKVYRYVLEQRNKELVSIDEELNFARTYVGLLKTRFEDSIEIEIPDHGSHPEAKVVPLSLQLLIENAVKHNIVSDNKPLKLKIYEQDNLLVIENNLQKKQVIKKSSGVGLQNIASRYSLLTNRKMSIEETASLFKVHLPVLTNEPEIVTQKSNNMEAVEDIKLIKAKKQVAKIKNFYNDVIRMVFILLFLAGVNYFTGDFPWVIFPAIGMGTGLFFKYMRIFNKNFFLGNVWGERKIENLMNDDKF